MSEENYQIVYMKKELENEEMFLIATESMQKEDLLDEYQNILNDNPDVVVILGVLEGEDGKIAQIPGIPNNLKEIFEGLL